jgi:large subunit ribosomal protein L13
MIIDATNLIVGRIATIVAKKALLGEKIDIINCENAVLTGSKKQILEKFKQRRDRGVPLQGPYYPRMPDMLVKRMIRGMLPWKRNRGRVAFKNIKCYIGVPEELKDKEATTIEEANISKVPSLKYVHIKNISKFLGAKIE